MALTWSASLARKTGATILATRRPSRRGEASLTQSRVRCTAQCCQAAPWKTSAMALLGPPCASEVTSSTPLTLRALTALRNASQES